MAIAYLFTMTLPRTSPPGAPLCVAFSSFPTTDMVVAAVRAASKDFDTETAAFVLRADLPPEGLSMIGLRLERAAWNDAWASCEKRTEDGLIYAFHKVKLHAPAAAAGGA